MFRLLLLLCGLLMLHGCSPMHQGDPYSIPGVNSTRSSRKGLPPEPMTGSRGRDWQVLPPEQARPVPSISKRQPLAVAPLPRKRLPLAYHRSNSHGVALTLVSFDSRDYQLRVADQPEGPGSRWPDARSAAATYNGFAAINGGFFTPEGKPLGLLIETGTRRGFVNRSSVGTGMFVSSKTASAIIRREQFRTSAIASHAYNLLQTGPMLVENAHPVAGLSTATRRPRSFLAWDGNKHWAIGYTDAATLSELARSLAGTSPAGFKIHTAVNLDGGRSSDLWAGPDVRNGNKTHRGFLHNPARNYLVLIPR